MENISYEVINKESGAIYKASEIIFDDEKVTFRTEAGLIEFSNSGEMGQLENDDYLVRQVGSHLEPDGDGIVEVPEVITDVSSDELTEDEAPLIEEI